MLVTLLGCGSLFAGGRNAAQLPAEATKMPDLSESRDWQEIGTTVSERNSRILWIDNTMNAIIDEDGPGAAVLVIDDGEIVHIAGYGMADVEQRIPVMVDDRFHFGSAGKQFTALGIVMLAEEGLLEYDQPVGTYIPELEFLGDGVTIRRLLQHTSAIPDYDEDDALYDVMMEMSDMPTGEDLVAAIADAGEMNYEAGEIFSYSNAGYEVLGVVIERISGQSYPDFFAERVFEKLAMDGSFSLPNPNRMTEDHIAHSYSMEDGEVFWYKSDELDNLTGSGSFYTSPVDLARYELALQSGALLPPEVMAVMFEPARLNSGETIPYGFGWDIGTFQGEEYVGHSGAWLAFESCYLRVPEEHIAVIVLMNYDYAETDAETLAFDILNKILDR